MTTPYESDLEYLQDELEWIEERARRRELEGRIADHFSNGRESWETSDDIIEHLDSQLDRRKAREAKLRDSIDSRLEATRTAGTRLALDKLVAMYGLDDMERKILLLTGSVGFSRRFNELFKALPGGSFGLTVEAIFSFFDLDFVDRMEKRRIFSPTSPLISHDLISVDVLGSLNNPEDLLEANVGLSNRIFSHMVGDEELLEDFLGYSSLENPHSNFEDVVLCPDDKSRILSVIDRHDEYLKYRQQWGFDRTITYGKGVLMLFYGPPGTGKTMMAHGVASRLNKRILTVDMPTLITESSASNLLPGLFREARLQNAIAFFDECEALFGSRRTRGNELLNVLLTEVERFEGIAILATNLPEQLDEALHRRILVRVHFPEPDREARQKIWERHLPEEAPIAPDVDVGHLAEQFELTGGLIKNAVLAAVADVVHHNGDTPVLTMEALSKAARDQICPIITEGGPVVIPKTRLEHLILPDGLKSQICELVAAIRNRKTVLQTWGLGAHTSYVQGTVALLYGPPGTGKTMAAEAIAQALHRPLMNVGLADLTSGWAGGANETVESLFEVATAQNAVIVIEKADALLPERRNRRADHPRDLATQALITKIERHDGLVLMTANGSGELDAALERRIDFALHFPHPDVELRTRIWESLITEDMPIEGPIDFERLGRNYSLSGGRIRTVLMRAALRAARQNEPLTMKLLEQTAEEETSDKEKTVMGFVG